MCALSVPTSTYPAVGEVFELTLDGDAPENQPLEMVRRAGYSRSYGWVVCRTVAGTRTRCFKLVSVGYCRNPNALMGKLAEHGTIPEGQWCRAFEVAYPEPDGGGVIGIADFSWVDPYGGQAHFPYVSVDGRLDFSRAVGDFDGNWRWIVEVEG